MVSLRRSDWEIAVVGGMPEADAEGEGESEGGEEVAVLAPELEEGESIGGGLEVGDWE